MCFAPAGVAAAGAADCAGHARPGHGAADDLSPATGQGAAMNARPALPCAHEDACAGTPLFARLDARVALQALREEVDALLSSPWCDHVNHGEDSSASTSSRSACSATRSEEHTSELQSQSNLVCRLLL